MLKIISKSVVRILLAIMIGTFIYAQIVETESSTADYLGLTKPGVMPEVFAPNFISTQYTEFAGTFSPDFKEYYFTRRGPFPNGLAQIMVTKKINGNWTSPTVADFCVNNYEFEPFITHDGNLLYFGSRRSPDGIMPPGAMHQWYLEKENSAWSEPILLGTPFFERMVMYPTVANNGTIYFTGIDGIYYSEQIEGVYQEPVRMGNEINFLPLTAHSFIAPNESFMIFDGQPRVEGKSDLYISYKRDDDSWTKGKSLGDQINSGESQAIASVSPDGECLFFSRNLDIYWSDASIIDEIKLIPEIVIEPDSGRCPLTVYFTPNLETVPEHLTAFEWDFENDGFIDSREQNPEYTFFDAGIYSVRLKVFSSADSSSLVFTDLIEVTNNSTGVNIDDELINSDYRLYQNFPNPFNGQTNITFEINKTSLVRIEIFNSISEKVATILNEQKLAGEYSIWWNAVNKDGDGLNSGIYFIRFNANNFSSVCKALLLN